MKHFAACIICFFLFFVSQSQTYSVQQRRERLNEGDKIDNNNGIDTLASKLYSKFQDSIRHVIDTIKIKANQERIKILSNPSLSPSEQEKKLIELQKKLDLSVARNLEVSQMARYWDGYNQADGRALLPALYSGQAINFYEGDSVYVKFFGNNLVNYRPKERRMILYTEAVSDYIGPVRVGIGFQIKSDAQVDSLSTKDSTVKKEVKSAALASLPTGGGDINVNLHFPIFKSDGYGKLIKARISFYANAGFSLPVLSQASDNFLLNYDGGVDGILFADGFNKKITFFSQFKMGYYGGNKNFQDVIKDANKDDPSSFFLGQASVGIDFLDGYRLKADLNFGNKFIRDNFPATITFVIRPGGNKNDKKSE